MSPIFHHLLFESSLILVLEVLILYCHTFSKNRILPFTKAMHTMQIFNDVKDVSHSLKVFLRKQERLGLSDFLLKYPRGQRKLQYFSISFLSLLLS